MSHFSLRAAWEPGERGVGRCVCVRTIAFVEPEKDVLYRVGRGNRADRTNELILYLHSNSQFFEQGNQPFLAFGGRENAPLNPNRAALDEIREDVCVVDNAVFRHN